MLVGEAMHKGIIAYIIVLVIIVIVGYISTDGFRGFSTNPFSTVTTSTVPAGSSVSSTVTTTIKHLNNCNGTYLYLSAPNSTIQASCRWTGGPLGIWVASGRSSSIHFEIQGANNVTYVNSTVGHAVYNCTTFFKNFAAPAQNYNIILSSGPAGGTCNSYSSIKLNTSVAPPPLQAYKQVYNGDFVTGDFTGWNITNKGFANGPMNIVQANKERCYIGAPWTGYNGTFFATTFNCGLSNAPGNLTSSPFIVDEPFLNFRLVSPSDQYLYVEILLNGTPVIIAHYNTYNVTAFGATSSYTFRNATIPLISVAGKVVQVRVVADTLKQHNYIAIGDFSLQSKPSSTIGVVANYSS